MKKLSIYILILLIMSVMVIAPHAYAGNSCGCQIKAAAKSADGCICGEKKIWNPLTWFKKCPVCDAKKSVIE